ncbi:MAG: beta-ketoacyl-ACP synthase 3 [Clostridia bacterium]|nr:beta-ketoacyl-ACP synthase 3 [Clostridia bacterium]
MSINTKITGVGSYLPETIVTNAMIEDILDTSDEWIIKRTGIRQRRVVKDETTTYMAVEAAKRAVENAGIKSENIELIIGSTISGDVSSPAIASYVQRTLGCENVAAMDVAAGCTGFIYAMATAISLMETLNKNTAVVVASENLSCRSDWSDRSSCILFGDGAGAVVIERSESNSIYHPVLHAIPDTDDVLYVASSKYAHPWSKDIATDDCAIRMDGKKVFAFAVDAVEKTLNELTELCGDKPITKIILHQANNRIIRYAATSSSYDKDQFFVNVDRLANTSSASIPLAIDEAAREGWLKKGDVVALVGFGAGLSYGGIIIEWAI